MNELVAYKSSITNLKALLGLGCFHIIEKEEFMPYIGRVIEKLNTWITLEDKSEHQDNVKLFVEYYNDGLSKLTTGELPGEYGYEDLSDSERDCFIFSWTNIFTTLYLELLYSYPSLFTTAPIDCHECCGIITEDSEGNSVYKVTKENLSIGGCGCV